MTGMEALVEEGYRRGRTRAWRAALALACLGLGSAAWTADAPDIPALMRDFGVGSLSGEPTPVILPDLTAFCSLAHLAAIDLVVEAWAVLAYVIEIARLVPIS